MVCSGESERSLSPTANMLRKHGIRPILNYAAEDDVTDSPGPTHSTDTAAQQLCHHNMLLFLKSIEGSASREGFVAAKVPHANLCMKHDFHVNTRLSVAVLHSHLWQYM